MKDKVFISYRHSDIDKVLPYCDLLKRLNVDYFIDIDGINGGNYDGKLLKELRESTVFVLFISFDSIQSKDVLQEVSTAQALCNKRGYPIILPIYLDEIDNMEDNDLYFYVHNKNCIMHKEDKLIVFEKKVKKICQNTYSETKIKNTYYSLDYTKEVKRLELQQNLILSYDMPIYKRITKNKNDLVMLDIGSGLGNSIINRINKLNEEKTVISKLIGLEYDNDSVVEANKKHCKSNVKFYNVDVEDENFSDILKNICEENKVEKFDLINISLVLLHLYDPFKVLVKLRRFLKPNGVFFIRDVDDGFTFGYPDPNNIIEKTLQIVDQCETSGNRKSGRRIGSFLKQLEFKNIELVNFGTSIKNLSFDEKEAFFDMCFSWMIDDVENMQKKYNNSFWQENVKFVKESIETIQDLFHRNEFIYSLGTMIFIASNDDF